MTMDCSSIIQIDDCLVSSEILSEYFACDYPKCKGCCCIIGDSGAPLEESEPEAIEKNYAIFSSLRMPISCWRYPIRVSVLSNGMKALNLHRWEICKDAFAKGRKEGIRVYQFLKEPLTQAFGEDFYRALECAASQLGCVSSDTLPPESRAFDSCISFSALTAEIFASLFVAMSLESVKRVRAARSQYSG